MIKAGFVVRNKFQIRQFEALAKTYKQADFLLYDRPSLRREFSKLDLSSFSLPIRLFNQYTILDAVADYDVLFFQTVFPGIECINGVPLISVQYGLAKERHNYGEWRALADLNLMFGSYSAKAVSHFAPSHAVGNLKYCGWNFQLSAVEKVAAKHRLGLDSGKPSILYMPTYGALGSFDELVDPLASLSNQYEILIKGHHNDEASGPAWIQRAKAAGHKHLFTGGSDQRLLLEAADIVISDFSGAVFDAVYARLPVLLYQTNVSSKIGLQKFELSSLEYRKRDELGRVCSEVRDIPACIDHIIERSGNYVERAASLRDQLFVDVSTATSIQAANSKVDDLLSGRVPRLSTSQAYVRESVQKLLYLERKKQFQWSSKSFWKRQVQQVWSMLSR